MTAGLGREVRREIVGAIATVAVAGLGTGATVPLVSLKLAATGVDTAVIGLMAALPAVGLLLGAPFVGAFARRIPPRRVLLLAVAGSALVTVPLAGAPALWAWPALRLISGACTAALFVLGETWINQATPDRLRGRMVATYATAFTGCQLAGPGLIALLGSEGPAPVAMAVAAHLIGIGLLGRTPGGPVLTGPATGWGFVRHLRRAPAVVAAVVAFAFFDSAVLALFPLYGMAHGHSEPAATLMISAILAGDAALQVPIGWLADRWGRSRVHTGCGVTVVLIAALLPVLIAAQALGWPALVLLGAAAGSIETLALVAAGNRYAGQQLLEVNAGLSVVWAVGSLLGPLLGSVAIDAVGPDGLMIALAAVMAAFVLVNIGTRNP
ncbi:MFS transporter [Pseudonocardia sp. GCM10023141]|uniref:MFS transporter n=1 Tax=Pseudonocardia sp. GCM10023141 TaxID=3252653 RepID=UPI00360D3EE3